MKWFAACAVLLLSLAALAEEKRDPDQTLYALGAILGRKVAPFRLTARELQQVQRGFADAAGGKPLQLDDADLEEWGPRVDAMMARRTTPALEAEREKGARYAERAAREAGARRLPSGIVIKTLRPGAGAPPGPQDKVEVNYEGRLLNGTVFDSSARHGGPAGFRLNQVIPCWTQGVQQMKVGEKATLICPSTFAYGSAGRPPLVPGGATLLFDVELLGVEK